MLGISVIIPVYNTESWLPHCLDSIREQYFSDIEIICVNDGSTDKSLNILREYAKEDARIQVINQKHQGAQSARYIGTLSASNKYVTYIDSDDWISKDAYQEIWKVVCKHDVDCVLADMYADTGETSTYIKGGFSSDLYEYDALKNIIHPNMISCGDFYTIGIFPSMCGNLFRRDLAIDILSQQDRAISMGDDATFVFSYLLRSNSIYITNQAFYHYRQHNSSMVKTISERSKERTQYDILQKTGLRLLGHSFAIYSKWLEYLLFLMIQRADALYDNIENLSYLFPFPNIQRGADILLYGASTYGQRMYQWLKEAKFCNVVGWYDQNAAELSKQGLPVLSPEKIAEQSTADIAIAVTIAKTRKAIFNDLRLQFPDKRIHMIDVDLILSAETRQAFRLD